MSGLKELNQKIISFCQNSLHNRLPDSSIIFDSPLLGTASAEDDLFKTFQSENIVGASCLPPGNWLTDAKTVISYFLPFCGVCIDRCPAGAISEEGKDKAKCHYYMFINDNIKEART